jgi:hypothetical protein
MSGVVVTIVVGLRDAHRPIDGDGRDVVRAAILMGRDGARAHVQSEEAVLADPGRVRGVKTSLGSTRRGGR